MYPRVAWLIHVSMCQCDTTDPSTHPWTHCVNDVSMYAWHILQETRACKSYMCSVTDSSYVPYTGVPWLIHVWCDSSYVCTVTDLCVTWLLLVHMCALTHSCATRLIIHLYCDWFVCGMNHICVCRNSFTCDISYLWLNCTIANLRSAQWWRTNVLSASQRSINSLFHEFMNSWISGLIH